MNWQIGDMVIYRSRRMEPAIYGIVVGYRENKKMHVIFWLDDQRETLENCEDKGNGIIKPEAKVNHE